MREFKVIGVAGIILGVGFLLSLPFRQNEGPAGAAGAAESDLAWRGGDLLQVPNGIRPIEEQPPQAGATIGTPVVVRAGSVARTPTVPRMGDHYQPAFSTGASDVVASLPIRPSNPPPGTTETWHRLRQGDSLERLARRYLGSEQYARWIYDSNRDKLSNPEVLPLNVEIRILAPPQ